MHESRVCRQGLRQRKKAKLRDEMTRTALELFVTNGYRQTRVSDIVDRLDISQPTFFRYFPSKEAVLREVIGQSIRQTRKSCRAARSEGPRRHQNVEETIQHLLLPLTMWVRRNPGLMRVLVESGVEPWVSSSERHEGNPFHRAINRLISHQIRRWQQRGMLRQDFDADVLGDSLTGASLTIAYDWVVRGQPYDLDARVAEAVGFLLRGVVQP